MKSRICKDCGHGEDMHEYNYLPNAPKGAGMEHYCKGDGYSDVRREERFSKPRTAVCDCKRYAMLEADRKSQIRKNEALMKVERCPGCGTAYPLAMENTGTTREVPWERMYRGIKRKPIEWFHRMRGVIYILDREEFDERRARDTSDRWDLGFKAQMGCGCVVAFKFVANVPVADYPTSSCLAHTQEFSSNALAGHCYVCNHPLSPNAKKLMKQHWAWLDRIQPYEEIREQAVYTVRLPQSQAA